MGNWMTKKISIMHFIPKKEFFRLLMVLLMVNHSFSLTRSRTLSLFLARCLSFSHTVSLSHALIHSHREVTKI